MNWEAVGSEAVELLRRYLAIDTTNPPGNEAEGARFLREVLAADGIASEIAESAPGRANLMACLRGDRSAGGIVLHHHIDVVYADRRYWSVDPFSGELRDGYVYGRGALDMKSIGIIQLAALLALARTRVPLKRDLIYLATADEEAGSHFGAQFVANERRHWLDGAEYALSELGVIEHRPTQRAPLATIVISEKTGLPMRLTARAAPGHGSMPWADTAPNRLIRALGRLLAAERAPRVLPEVQQFFVQLAAARPGGEGRGYEDLATSLADPEFRRRFQRDRHHAALVQTTFALTKLKGSDKSNVIPPEATADIDCRMLAGDEPEEILAWVRGVVDDEHVAVEALRPPKQPNMSPPDTELYKQLGDALRRRAPGALVAPEIMTGFTDNWVFRRCGLQAYGFGPFVLDEGEWSRVHGNDERISVENVHGGVRCYTEMLLAMAGA
jgi:acetylornithine deacetylase/succinyl-diaminopimelate desuccinylase-like protein